MTTTATDKGSSARADGLTAIVDAAVSSHARAVAVLVLAALLAFLPGFFQIPPTDRDEARFAQATKQMLETGEYVDIRFQDEVRYKKPVGIYWLQAAVVKTAEALGVPNAPPDNLALSDSLADRRDRRGAADLLDGARFRVAPRRRCWPALMMATSILLGVEARLAKTDAMLLLTVVAAMGAMARIYLGERRPAPSGSRGWTLPAIFWTALAAGILLKGPLIVMFVGARRGRLGGDGPLGALAAGAAAAHRPALALPPGAALVRRHRQPRRRRVSSPSRSGRICSARCSARRRPMARRRVTTSRCSG